jgi:hypothetical protein
MGSGRKGNRNICPLKGELEGIPSRASAGSLPASLLDGLLREIDILAKRERSLSESRRRFSANIEKVSAARSLRIVWIFDPPKDVFSV